MQKVNKNMPKTLFINSCIREESRTLMLVREYLKTIDGEITEVDLKKEELIPLDAELLSKRDASVKECKFDDPMFRYAKQFAEADNIVIAAPFWDLGFPSLLKIYIENIMVAGITFKYSDGRPMGICRAESLKYITTSGGPVKADFGYTYVKQIANDFFNIGNVSCRRAENLDFYGITADEFFEKAEIIDIE